MKTRMFAIVIAAAAAVLAGCNSSQKSESASASETKVVNTTKPVNSKCPLTGEALPANAPTVSYNNQTVGFCCPGCASKFNAMTAAQKEEKVKTSM